MCYAEEAGMAEYLASAWGGLVVDQRVDECERLLDVGLLVTAHEEVIRHVCVARECRREDACSLRPHMGCAEVRGSVRRGLTLES